MALFGDFQCFIFLGNAAWPATWIAAALARLRGRRVLFWTHGWTKPDRGIKKLMRRGFYSIAHELLLYGEFGRQLGIKAGVSPDKLHVIYNSLDADSQQTQRARISTGQKQRLRRELFSADHIPVVIASARLTPTKRFELLIGAVGRLMRRGHEVKLLIVGEGPERESLEDLATRLGVPVVFYGACYDEEELSRLFTCASVTVSPGNVGLTCMHSLGYGIPVITHDDPFDQMPEWEAITPGVTGDFFRKDSEHALELAIERWTRTPFPDEATQLRCVATIVATYHPANQRRIIDERIDVGSERSPAAQT